MAAALAMCDLNDGAVIEAADPEQAHEDEAADDGAHDGADDRAGWGVRRRGDYRDVACVS
jgi:hypothetical protein